MKPYNKVWCYGTQRKRGGQGFYFGNMKKGEFVERVSKISGKSKYSIDQYTLQVKERIMSFHGGTFHTGPGGRDYETALEKAETENKKIIELAKSLPGEIFLDWEMVDGDD